VGRDNPVQNRICNIEALAGTEGQSKPGVNPPSAQKTHNCAEKTVGPSWSDTVVNTQPTKLSKPGATKEILAWAQT